MTLDEEYQKTIDDQRTYLLKLQEDFNKACEVSKVKAKEALKKVPKDDKEAREAVLQAQKAELDEALMVLKQEVDKSTRETMKKLEGIMRQKEELVLKDLENQLASL